MGNVDVTFLSKLLSVQLALLLLFELQQILFCSQWASSSFLFLCQQVALMESCSRRQLVWQVFGIGCILNLLHQDGNRVLQVSPDFSTTVYITEVFQRTRSSMSTVHLWSYFWPVSLKTCPTADCYKLPRRDSVIWFFFSFGCIVLSMLLNFSWF